MHLVYDREDKVPHNILSSMKKGGELALAYVGIKDFPGEVSLSLVSGEEIRAINREYRKLDRETDVLSFPQFENCKDIICREGISLGDVVISPEIAKKQSIDYGHGYDREIVYLFVHSMFHLLGMDHMNEDEKVLMRAGEKWVLERLDLNRE